MNTPDHVVDALVSANLALVHFVVRRSFPRIAPPHSYDDLVGIGTLGLMAAARSFNAARGVTFGTHAVHRIRYAILDELRHVHGRRIPVPDCEDVDALPLSDGSPTALEALIGAEYRDRVRAAVHALPERERLVILLSYWHHERLEAIGACLGLTKGRVSQIRQRAVERLRVTLSGIAHAA